MSLAAICVAGLVIWFFHGMWQFHNGWMQLEPRCVEEPNDSLPEVFPSIKFARGFADNLRDIVASEYNSDIIRVDEDGIVYVKPALYYAEWSELDRFSQMLVRPIDRRLIPQSLRISCEELQPFVRSKIDVRDGYGIPTPVTFYLILRQPDQETFRRWASDYRN